MSKFQFKNRTYLKISADDLISNAPLSCAVFIFLEKNERLFKIRDRHSSFEEASLRAYQLKSKNQLYILDPKENAESFSFEGELNPKILSEYLPAPLQKSLPPDAPAIDAIVPLVEQIASAPQAEPAPLEQAQELAVENSQSTSSEPIFESIANPEAEFAPGTIIEQESKPAAFAEEIPPQQLETIQEPSESSSGENIAKASKQEEINQALENAKLQYQAALDRDQAKRNIDSSDGDQSISPLDQIEESTQRISKGPEELEAERKFGIAKKQAEEERKFSSNSESEEEQTFSSQREEEEETRISAWQSKDDKETKKISKQMDALEEEFSKISPDSKEFAEELQIIAAAKSDEKREWNTRLPENSPKLLGLEKHDAASLKLSHSLGQHLANLRAELNNNSRMTPSDKSTEQDLKTRKSELKQSIEKNEVLFVLMESLDDEEMEISELPEPYQSMSKPDLVRHVEKSLKELKGSLLLSEEDSLQVQKKVEIIKAKHLSMFGDSIDSAKAKLVALEDTESNAEEAEKITADMEKEYIKTSITINITKEIVKKRSELAELIKKAASSGPSRVAAEEEAFRYQESIRELESLAFSVESDEPVEETKIAPYRERMPEEFRFSPGAEKKQEIQRISQSLDRLKETLVQNKVAAEESESSLREIIDGNEADEEVKRAKMEEEEVKKLVSGSDGKFLQSGVFAATFFRNLGYLNKKLERDLLLATYLFETEEAEFQAAFPEVLPIYRAARESHEEDEIVAKDIALAIQLARGYNQWPGVITGKFSVDSNLFRTFYEGLEKNKFDPIMLERLKIKCEIGQSKSDRESILALAKAANEQIKKWRRTNAA